MRQLLRETQKNDMILDIKAITRGKMETTATTTKCFLERINRKRDIMQLRILTIKQLSGLQFKYSNKNLCSGYYKEKQKKTVSENSMRDQLADPNKG